MANIKTSPKEWEEAREYFEAGLSLSAIVAKTGISKTQISKQSSVEGWAKGLPANKNESRTDSPNIVYIITANEYRGIYKIGITNDIEQRIKSMQTGCPFVLLAIRVYVATNPTAIEIMLHAFFHKKRLIGEWFSLNEIDLQYIDDALTVIKGTEYGS